MSNPSPESSAPSFEQALALLERIVQELEEGEIGLAEALARYEEGVGLLKQCHQTLAQAERKIELLSHIDEQGRPAVQAFEEGPTTLEEKAEKRTARRGGKRDGARPSARPAGDASDAVDDPGALF